MNAERILIGAECIGDSRWFIQKASEYAKDRTVFQRPIGQNQGIQFPIAKTYAQSEAADLMVRKAATLFDSGKPCGKEANMAKLLAADASWEAADVCLQTHGGFGFAEEYDIERNGSSGKPGFTGLHQCLPHPFLSRGTRAWASTFLLKTEFIGFFIGFHILRQMRFS